MTETATPRPQTGRTGTVLVTGATNGMGLLLTRRLADQGHHVLATGRTLDRLPTCDLIHPVRLDQSRLAAVDDLVDTLDARGLPPLTAVVCNAGLQLPGHQVSPDGFELTMAVNVLSHLRLIDRLVPRLGPGSRIVLTTSGTHDPDDTPRLPHALETATVEDLVHPGSGPSERPLAEGFARYATSKLALVRVLPRLARDLQPRRIGVLGFDPGLMPGTGLARNWPAPMRRLWPLLTPLVLLTPGSRPATRSARDLAALAVDERWADVSGAHVFARRTSGTSRASHHLDTGDRWYEDLLRLVDARHLGGRPALRT